ncbi:GHKL domain-containing protein [Corynebacterium sp. zg-331]|uniref:sensor histidine kinase n=1 Tax=unclassified Corynebacterium TaxID=2624378 RepID=UPI00128B2F0B|nr:MULTISPECIES: histidine kinase [unclassified Corynebacterium]MBC3186516.1 GHKL domain-containing protein [Corynebacterium sp. zg-331]MPV53001.1 GHKL domain-containing protein [Corynebacterium sp. zg331]
MDKLAQAIRCVPREGWVVLCAMSWVVFALWMSEPYEISAESALWTAVLTTSVALVVRYPLLGSLGFLFTFALTVFLPHLFLPPNVFLCAVVMALVGYHGKVRLVLFDGVAVGILGLIDRHSRAIEADFSAVLIWEGFMVVTAFAGWTLGRKVRQKIELAEQWRDEYRKRREELASTLHDSVAASLTSIVMRSEVLAMQEAQGSALHGELSGIAEDARMTMSQVRSLLSLLNAPQDRQEKPSGPALVDTVKEVTAKMREHHLSVIVVDESAEVQITNPTLEMLHKVLLEGATNAIKYATPGSEVRLHAASHEGGLRITMSNEIASEEERRGRLSSSVLSSGLGMRMMRRSVASMGGKLSTHSDGKTWTLSIDF